MNPIFHVNSYKAKKINCYVALTRPKFENWVGRSIFFFFFFFLRTVRELSFPIFFLKFLNGENSGGMQSKRIYTSAFLGHWIHILANSSPKSDIKKKIKKNRPCFFPFYGRSGEGNITIFLGGLSLLNYVHTCSSSISKHTDILNYFLLPHVCKGAMCGVLTGC